MSIKRRADVLLGLTGIAYMGILIYQLFVDSVAVNAMYWCLQSAFIGSVADWFAVTALFERPLGIKFHTALLPNKKAEVINSIVKLVNEHLIKAESYRPLVSQFKIMPYLNRYLTSDSGRRALRTVIHHIVRWIVHSKTPEEWALLGAKKLQTIAEKQQISLYVRDMLLRLCNSQNGDKQLVELAEFLQRVLHEPMTQTRLYAFLNDVLKQQKPQGMVSSILFNLAELFNVVNAEDLRDSVTIELDAFLEEWKHPHSELRRTCLKEWSMQIAELSPTSPSGMIIESVYARWLRTQNLQAILLTYVWPYVNESTAGENYEANTHIFANSIEETLHQLWLQYGQEETTIDSIEGIFQEVLTQVLAKSKDIIDRIVRSVLGGLSDEDFNAFIRPKVEADLSWIRINGALVGGCIGLIVWGFLFFIYEPLVGKII